MLKWITLTLMLIQNAGFVLIMRHSRKTQAEGGHAQYNVSMVVTLQEAFKLVLCVAVLALQARSLRAGLLPLSRPRELASLAIPAVCFTLQNNILYVALSNLDPLVFQITYQLKTLLTALFSVCMLGRVLSRWQWLSQVALMAGIVLVQLNEAPATSTRPSATADAAPRRVLLGLGAVVLAAISSAFASVYFEGLLKGKGGKSNGGGAEAGLSGGGGKAALLQQQAGSIWARNIHLSAWTVPLNLLLAMASSASASGAASDVLLDPLRGFEPTTWGVVVVNGLGGLLVAAVIKYADNIWKGFATAGAIVLTGLLAPVLDLGPPPTTLLLVGAMLVIGSIFLYATPPKAPKASTSPKPRLSP